MRFKFLLLTLLLAGCKPTSNPSEPMEALKIPTPSSVINVEVINSDTPNTKLIEIKDNAQITSLIALLGGLNSNMYKTAFTYPTPQYGIVIHDREGTNLVVWIGPNWLGGRNNIKGPSAQERLTTLNETDRIKLLKLLGVTP